jgi:RNA polymerase sigma-70 factor (ECF subfamily)
MREHDALEGELRQHCDGSRWNEAASLLVRGYGPELYRFLVVAHGGDESDAGDTFSDLAEAVVRGLPTFAWESSARTWAYAIAHRLTLTRRRDAGRRRRRAADHGASSLEQIAQRVRTETASFLRTEKKSRLQGLRDSLTEHDRLLLLLRVDRELSWTDVARVMTEGTDLDEAAVTRETARLRKRYQLVKDRLRGLAQRDGLLK